MNLPPSPAEKHPYFGNALHFMRSPFRFFLKNAPKFGEVYWLQSPIRKVCVVNSPDVVKYVLQENHRHYVKSFAYQAIKPMLGEGLLTSEGDFWLKQRRLAQPAFHREQLASLVSIMCDCVEKALDRWPPSGSVVNISEEMNRLALGIVSKTLFHSDVSEETIREISKHMWVAIESGAHRIRNPFKLPLSVPTPGNIRNVKAIEGMDKIVRDIIRKRKAGGERHNDLLDMLLHVRDEETGEGMSDNQVRDEVMTLFVAGHETTAVTLAYAFYLLSVNPEAETKMLEEINRVMPGARPEPSSLKDLSYTRMVIDETLRLYPPAWVIGRKSTRNETFGPYEIPEGTTMVIPVYIFHHSDRYWENPEAFLPERFSAENADKVPKYAYFPFGGGPRLCIGNMFAIYEMLIVLSMVWKRYRFIPLSGYKVELLPLITLRSKYPLEMICFAR